MNTDYILSDDSCKENSIMYYDFTKLSKLYEDWITYLPNITPFYAVKCNDDIQLLHELRKLNVNFDCASALEIRNCIDIGISPERIIYANPCKFTKDIVYAYYNSISRMTFDTISELEKIYNLTNTSNTNTNTNTRDIELILRIYANDSTAQCNLSDKYGAEEHEWEDILIRAHDLGMEIVGISFHIGSGATNPNVFLEAIKQCRKLYEMAILYGFHLTLIDIGGGFTVNNFKTMATTINDALEYYFPPSLNCTFIAEPGRYFAESIATLFTRVIGKRIRKNGRIDYIVGDSLYGSFNCKLYDHALIPLPKIIFNKKNKHNPKIQHQTRIMGCTCDSNEILFDDIYLPQMELDDWIQINNFGAYTISAASSFNGINFRDIKSIYSYSN